MAYKTLDGSLWIVPFTCSIGAGVAFGARLIVETFETPNLRFIPEIGMILSALAVVGLICAEIILAHWLLKSGRSALMGRPRFFRWSYVVLALAAPLLIAAIFEMFMFATTLGLGGQLSPPCAVAPNGKQRACLYHWTFMCGHDLWVGATGGWRLSFDQTIHSSCDIRDATVRWSADSEKVEIIDHQGHPQWILSLLHGNGRREH